MMNKEMFQDILILSNQDRVVAITDNFKSYSLKTLQLFSKELFSVINQRCLVFCLCENKFESLAGYVTFITNRIVPLMLDGGLDVSLLNNLLSLYQPEYLWIPKEREKEFKGFQKIFSGEEYVLIKSSYQNQNNLNEDLALLLTTSGSTGSPKLVRLSYENILANANSIAEYLQIDENERPITALPMHYSFGLSIINSHLLKGATILLTSKSLMEKEFWALLKEEKATSLSGVPYTFEMLKRLRFFRMDLPYLKTLTQAGGKLNIDLNREFSEFSIATHKRFFVMYGQTEATARMSYLPYEYSMSKLGSIGVPIPGGEFSLEDENNQKIEEFDHSGELVYKGRNVSLGYAEKRADLSKGDENNGILYTGDLARKDEEGFYYIVGRKKRFIKLFGNRINLDEVERLLKSMNVEGACVGDDNVLVLYLTQKGREQEAKQYLSTTMGIHASAIQVRLIGGIPRNASGKIMYSQLKV